MGNILKKLSPKYFKNKTISNFAGLVETYLGGSPYGFCFLDGNGVITYVNKKVEEITGYKKEYLKGLDVKELPFVKSGEIQRADDVSPDQSDDQTLIYEARVKRKDGQYVWLFFTVIPIKPGKSGESIGNIVFVYDQTYYKKLEEELKFSDAALRSIQEGMVISDNDFKVTFMNEAAERIYGAKIPEIKGKSIPDFIKLLWPSSDLFGEECEDYDKNGIGHYEHLIEVCGCRKWTDVIIQRIKDNKGNGIANLAIINDITRRKENEEKLRFSDAAFKSIQEGVIAIDNEGEITHWNAVCERMYGIDASRAVGRLITDVIHGEDDKGIQIDELSAMLEQSAFLHTEQLFRTESASVWVDLTVQAIVADGKNYGWVLLSTDITQRKLAEKKLRESEASLAKAQSIAGIGSWYWDFVPGDAFWSDEFFRLFGYQPHEVTPSMKLVQDAAHPEDRDALCRMMEANIKEGATGDIIVRFFRKDGKLWFADVVADAVRDKDGNLKRVFGYIQDISKIKEAEEREKQMQLELQGANRLASIGEMASGLAHEINNPLTGIIGFSQLLIEKDIPADIKDDLETINREAQRAAGIVRGLLTFAHQQRLGRSMVNINEVILETLKLRAYELELCNIGIATELDADIPETAVDVIQIQQVFLNIILNAEQAIKSIHKAGTITVRTEKIGNNIRVSFIDDGPGIKKGDLHRIFNPFFTTKEVGKGTGLGLSMSHGIVTQHGGKISVESEFGQGAKLIVELPINDDVTAVDNCPEQIYASQNGFQKRGLIIDDERVVLVYLNRLMKDCGYEIETVNNGRDALNLIGIKDYDFILLDIKMPEMNGIDVYRRIIDINPSLKQKIIVVTGDVLERDTSRFIEETGVACINKPVNVDQLKKNLSRVLAAGN
jgi:PAS domain S-box-containing protein